MSTKQIRLLCLVSATDGVAAQLTVSVNGVQKFSGLVSQTVLAPGAVYTLPVELTQFSVVTLDQDAENFTVAPSINDRNEFGQYWSSGSYEFSATITGGDMSISSMQSNYNGQWSTDTPPVWFSGTADSWSGIYCASQPQWNGITIPGRFVWPVDPAQGPFAIGLTDNESLVYQIGLTKYSPGVL